MLTLTLSTPCLEALRSLGRQIPASRREALPAQPDTQLDALLSVLRRNARMALACGESLQQPASMLP